MKNSDHRTEQVWERMIPGITLYQRIPGQHVQNCFAAINGRNTVLHFYDKRSHKRVHKTQQECDPMASPVQRLPAAPAVLQTKSLVDGDAKKANGKQ